MTQQSNRKVRVILITLAAAALAIPFVLQLPGTSANSAGEGSSGGAWQPQEGGTMSTSHDASDNVKEAIFAGGCFWCIEAAFELMPGVIEAISGYTGGHVEDPTYAEVSTGTTGHFEAVLVRYDPEQISYEALLEQFWRNINPVDDGGQFYDRGSQYFTAIFYLDEEQRLLAEASKDALNESGIFDKPAATQIRPAETFYVAEDYHQDYYKTYTARYESYANASGRKTYLEETWEDQDDITLVPSPAEEP